MGSCLSRRSVFGLLPATFALPSFALADQTQDGPWAEYPQQNPKLVQEMVGASHGNIERVKELIAISPNLVKATYDWGYGDWESPIGAASHVGNHDIIKLLLDNGARPDLFTFAAMGNVAALKAMIEANPGMQKTLGPHGITLLVHARIGGEVAKPALEYLTSLGDAGLSPTNLPLTDAEKDAYVGTYKYGIGPTEAFVVEINKAKNLTIKREGGMARSMNRVEDHAFNVSGAPHLRIRFTLKEGKAQTMVIHDAAPVLTGVRA